MDEEYYFHYKFINIHDVLGMVCFRNFLRREGDEDGAICNHFTSWLCDFCCRKNRWYANSLASVSFLCLSQVVKNVLPPFSMIINNPLKRGQPASIYFDSFTCSNVNTFSQLARITTVFTWLPIHKNIWLFIWSSSRVSFR